MESKSCGKSCGFFHGIHRCPTCPTSSSMVQWSVRDLPCHHCKGTSSPQVPSHASCIGDCPDSELVPAIEENLQFPAQVMATSSISNMGKWGILPYQSVWHLMGYLIGM